MSGSAETAASGPMAEWPCIAQVEGRRLSQRDGKGAVVVRIEAVMTEIKRIALPVPGFLALTLMLNDTQAVFTRRLFAMAAMPLAALPALTLLAGRAGGMLVALMAGKRCARGIVPGA